MELSEFMERYSFPKEAATALLRDAQKLKQNDPHEAVFSHCQELLFEETEDPWPSLNAFARRIGVHPFTVHLLFLIHCTGYARENYRLAGISEEIFWDSMRDLKCKMQETRNVYGIWGVYCGPWLANFLRMKCFCLGRLQFELLHSPVEAKIAGHFLKKDAPVINMHIPSFGKLAYPDVLDAYRRAADFFQAYFRGGPIWFHCETWILYPSVNQLIPEGNMRRFSQDFQVVHTCIDPNQDDRYRIFGLPPDVPIAAYPENNILQKRLKSWLLQGNRMGVGSGVFIWKDQEVIFIEE